MTSTVFIVPTAPTQNWKPTSNLLTEAARGTLRKLGASQMILSLLGMVFGIVVASLTGSATNAAGHAAIIVFYVILLILGIVALITSFGLFGNKENASSSSSIQQPLQPGQQPAEVDWNVNYWKKEGLERFFAWIGLSLENFSSLVSGVVIVFLIMSIFLELAATLYGGYPSQIPGGYYSGAEIINVGRTFPIVALILSVVELVIHIVQMVLVSSFAPKGGLNSSADFGENLLTRARALGCLLALESMVVSLYCFSSSDLDPHGPFTNFSSYYYQSESGSGYDCDAYGICKPTFQVTVLFYALGAAFGGLLEFATVACIVGCSLLIFKGTTLKTVFKGILFTISVIVFLIFLAAFIVEIVFLILSLASPNGLLRTAIILGGYSSGAYGYAESFILVIMVYMIIFIVPVACALACIQQFYKIVKQVFSVVNNYVSSFQEERPEGILPLFGAGGAMAVVMPPAAPAGYPPQQGAYPPQQGAYPPQQGAYPPQQGAYPPQQGAYPPQQGAYPPQQGAYPPQQGAYPPQQGAYPPQQGGFFPPASSYPPASAYPPQQGGGYAPQQ